LKRLYGRLGAFTMRQIGADWLSYAFHHGMHFGAATPDLIIGEIPGLSGWIRAASE
jgi:hypothetical protein